MFVHVIVTSCIVASVFASCVPNTCLNSGTCIANSDGVVCKCASGWDGPNCSTPFRYLGCYDDKTHAMSVRYPDSTSNSPLECARGCRDYNFGGVQFGKGCFCGNKLPLVKKPESDCNVKCPGDKTKKCGGKSRKSRISVYSNRDCMFTGDLTNPTNGAVYINGTALRSVATYTCSSGFKLTGVSTRTCVLGSGWSDVAPTCVADINECSSNPCKNGGKCVDRVNQFVCVCAPGYSGATCALDINECSSNPCTNGATCVDQVNQFVCVCAAGYSGATCDLDINECAPAPCKNSATCNNLLNAYSCTCAPGWQGTNCDLDVNECLPAPCKNGATCSNLLNAYSCACAPGWQGTNCDQDIDECKPGPCKNGATCSNLLNAYSCKCAPGWQGTNCDQDVNECLPAPCKNGATCNNLLNAYSCTCAPGWQGTNCDQDVNECLPAPCKNGATCNNLLNAYSCKCAPGWQGTNCDQDVNECLPAPCKNGATCNNLLNAYSCTCAPGWQGTNCDQDVNECLPAPCKNSATCNNLLNAYSCTCAPGWQGTNCDQDINECAPTPCKNGATCSNLLNAFSCACSPGWQGTNCDQEIKCAYPEPVQHASMSHSGLSPGTSVTYTCEPGYIMVSGDEVRTCHGNNGWTGTKPKCLVQNCVTLQNNAMGKLKSGLYQINRGGKNFHIYCNYGNTDAYVYVSPSVPSDLDLNMASLSDDSSHVKVIHRRQNGKQYVATIQQIAAFNTLPVSVQFNKHDGYKGLHNTAMGPYVFTGFVPLSHNVRNGVQGWKVNGKEITFTNCDGNPNSYFAVLFNANKAGYTSYKGWKNALMYAWYDLATLVPDSDSLPAAMFSPNYEIHHGGCGGYSIGTSESDITGVAIGQRFIITCSEPDDVRDATKTLGGVKPGSVVTYICNPGYTSSGDLVRTCTSTGGWSGVRPTCTAKITLY